MGPTGAAGQRPRRNEGPSHRGRRDGAAGATAAASGPPTLTRVGVPATDVPPSGPKGSDWRGGRAGPSTLRIQVARLWAWRVAGGTIWHERSTRSEAQRSGAQRRARAVGQFVKRDRRSRTRDGHQGPRSPAAGRAAFVSIAGAAGLAVLREGRKPGRGETRSGSVRSTTARPRSAGTRPGPPTSRSTLSSTEGTTSARGSAFGLNVVAWRSQGSKTVAARHGSPCRSTELGGENDLVACVRHKLQGRPSKHQSDFAPTSNQQRRMTAVQPLLIATGSSSFMV